MSDLENGLTVNGGGGDDKIVETRATAPLDYGTGLVQRSVEDHRDASGSQWLQERFDALQTTDADDALVEFLLEIDVI